jgi:CheY-like chemotaxis protein
MRKDIVILIVEDDKGHYVLTKHCLRRADISNDILWFADGQETLDFLYKRSGEQERDDDKKYLMLLDIRMPKVDGLKVLETVKQDTQLQNIPVIMLTTSDDQQQARHCYELGCDAHIVKPVGDVLVKVVQRVGQNL